LNFPSAEPDFWRLHYDLLVASDTMLDAICGHTSAAGEAYVAALCKADEQAKVEIDIILQGRQATSHFLRSRGSVR
jgi:hypothetical protein